MDQKVFRLGLSNNVALSLFNLLSLYGILMFLFISISVYSFIYLSVYLSIYIPIYLAVLLSPPFMARFLFWYANGHTTTTKTTERNMIALKNSSYPHTHSLSLSLSLTLSLSLSLSLCLLLLFLDLI